jgi:hypothetical protein
MFAAIAAGLTLLLTAEQNLLGDASPPPDSSEVSEAPMIGVFYDLKQTEEHQAITTDTTKWLHIIDEFLSKGWDETVLNHFYHSSKPLKTTQVFIPFTPSSQAPENFGLKKEVTPDFWLAYFKAQVSPPESGTYRFVAAGDDVIAIAVNGKTVLAAPLRDPLSTQLPLTKWRTSEPGGPQVGTNWSYYCCNGDWIEMKKDEPIDLDIIYGDGPDGVYSAYILVQEKGRTYQLDKEHHPILPIFQVAPYATPDPPASPAPLFTKGYPTWKCYQ